METKNETSLQNLIRAWTKELYVSFDDICYQYGISLRRPQLRIEDHSSFLGQWDAESRTITLALKLIQGHCWTAVLEVFKHEIAHQVVSELYQAHEAHGPLFWKACDKLGVAHWARRGKIESIPSEKESVRENKEEQALLRRAEKLLALAQSSNEHEALAAMQKVMELYDKSYLSRIGKSTNDDYRSLCISTGKKRVPSYLPHLTSLLVENYRVDVIYTKLFDPQSLNSNRAIELLGLKRDVELAEYVFHFLLNNLKLMWEAHQVTNKARGIVAKNSYYRGVLIGFGEKLRTFREQKMEVDHASTSSKALVEIANQQLAKFVRSKHPRLRQVTHGQGNTDNRSFAQGKKHGKALNLNKGVRSEGKGRALALPAPK